MKKKSNFQQLLYQIILILPLLTCIISCDNQQTLRHSLSSDESFLSSLPSGFEDFDEYRVFAQYGDSINGFDVKVMILPTHRTWSASCRAIINFNNKKGSFKIVHDGWRDNLCYDENKEIMLVPKDTVINLPYEKPNVPSKDAFTLDIFNKLPFFFYDIDFDGADELIIQLYAQGQRWSNAYEVIELQSDRLYSIFRKPPFTDLDDLTIIDPINKTITLTSYEGHGEELRTVYKIMSEGSMGESPKVKKEYTDDLCYWGVGSDTIPMYRRIYVREKNDTTDWEPIKKH